MEKILSNALLFIFPLFFLPLTQDYFITGKFYLVGFFTLLLILNFALKLLSTKKINWHMEPLDLPVVIFATAAAFSVLFSSPNKIQALLNPNFGLMTILFMTVLYFALSRTKIMTNWITLSSLVISLTAILVFFQPLKDITLSAGAQFLKSPLFTPLGSQLDLIVFLGFFAIINIAYTTVTIREKKAALLPLIILISNIVALGLTVYFVIINRIIVLPPLTLSWYAALETMKTVKTAIVGVGIDNFSTLFTKVKDLSYNQSDLWQIASFNIARNFPLHILIETGIIGLASFLFITVAAVKNALKNANKLTYFVIAYMLLIVFLIPPSLPILFLIFALLSTVRGQVKDKKVFNMENLPLLYIGIFMVLMAAVAGSGYLLGRAYMAEYYFKQAINGLEQNNIKVVYDNMRVARILNPFEERFILNFSQTNLFIADNFARKAADKITEQDRQIIAQAIQAAISEGKGLVRLNPNKSQSYDNLAAIYKNIIPITEGSDVWAISSYQRAIVLDPINPRYRFNLGGVYYLLGRYGEAARLFEQAVTLKPDWPNAYYNLAWSYYQNEEYDKAASAMQNVINLTDKTRFPQDFERATKDLNDFKNKMDAAEVQLNQTEQLNLPQESPELDPKIELPKEASPEAN